MRLIVYTQVWEGVKPKGHDEYLVAELEPNQVVAMGQGALVKLAYSIEGRLPNGDDLSEYVLDWELLDRDEHTWSEKDQLEFDGKITYPPRPATDLLGGLQ